MSDEARATPTFTLTELVNMYTVFFSAKRVRGDFSNYHLERSNILMFSVLCRNTVGDTDTKKLDKTGLIITQL